MQEGNSGFGRGQASFGGHRATAFKAKNLDFGTEEVQDTPNLTDKDKDKEEETQESLNETLVQDPISSSHEKLYSHGFSRDKFENLEKIDEEEEFNLEPSGVEISRFKDSEVAQP